MRTPGPWRVVLTPKGDRVAWPLVIVEEATDANILTECVGSASANGHLIAAAPELFDALRAVCQAFAYSAPEYMPSEALLALEKAANAVAKAESRPVDLPAGPPQENP